MKGKEDRLDRIEDTAKATGTGDTTILLLVLKYGDVSKNK
jgi:hypothetical protein